MFGLSTTHLIILLVIIVLIFGTKKLKNIGSDLGGAVKGFKDGMRNDGDKTAEPPGAATSSAPVAQVAADKPAAPTQAPIDVEAKPKS